MLRDRHCSYCLCCAHCALCCCVSLLSGYTSAVDVRSCGFVQLGVCSVYRIEHCLQSGLACFVLLLVALQCVLERPSLSVGAAAQIV